MESITPKKNKKLKKIFSVVGNIILTVYIIVALAFSACVFTSMRTGYPSVLGHTFLYVRTDSMESDAEDSIFEGDLVVCRDDANVNTLSIGQIIAYKATVYQKDNSGEVQEFEIVRIHRIVDIDEVGSYITRGDNSPDLDGDGVPDDDPTPANPINVIGVYDGTRIPKVGKVFDFLQGQNGILFCLVIPMAAFFIYALFKFVKAMIDYKLEKATSGAPTADGELTEEQKQAAIAEYLAKQAAEANKDENNTDN